MQVRQEVSPVSASYQEVDQNKAEEHSPHDNLISIAQLALNNTSRYFFPKKSGKSTIHSLAFGIFHLKQDTLRGIQAVLDFLESYSQQLPKEYSSLLTLFVHEILAKSLPYVPLKEGDMVRMPAENGRWCEYKVDKKLLVDGKIPCYAFLPKDPSTLSPPYLIFKGSARPGLKSLLYSKDAIATWRADIDHSGVGLQAFEASKEELQEWLEQACLQTGHKAEVIGHSLGGALSLLTAVNFPDFIKRARVFNAPMVREDLAKQYNEIDDSKRPKIEGYSCSYDLVAKVGGGCLIGEHFEISGYEAHLDHHSDPVLLTSTKFYIQEVDVENVNKSTHVSLLSLAAEHSTKALSPILSRALESLEASLWAS